MKLTQFQVDLEGVSSQIKEKQEQKQQERDLQIAQGNLLDLVSVPIANVVSSLPKLAREREQALAQLESLIAQREREKIEQTKQIAEWNRENSSKTLRKDWDLSDPNNKKNSLPPVCLCADPKQKVDSHVHSAFGSWPFRIAVFPRRRFGRKRKKKEASGTNERLDSSTNQGETGESTKRERN